MNARILFLSILQFLIKKCILKVVLQIGSDYVSLGILNAQKFYYILGTHFEISG